jgi:hypothetical protein
MPSLQLNASEASSIAAYLLQLRSPPDAAAGGFVVDAAKAKTGKELFARLNCAACHASEGGGKTSKPLAALRGRQPSGCLSTLPKAGVPQFEISDRQRVVILTQLGNQTALNEALTPEQQIVRTMTTLNCFACHSRGRRGGADGWRREYFAGPADLGDEGRFPSTLRGVGTRLGLGPLKASMLGGTVSRPEMATRMPLYGSDNIGHLPMLFIQADAPASPRPQGESENK